MPNEVEVKAVAMGATAGAPLPGAWLSASGDVNPDRRTCGQARAFGLARCSASRRAPTILCDPSPHRDRMADILVRRDGGIGTLVFSNLEKHNAMTADMWEALPSRIAELDRDPEVRVIVLSG